MSINYQSLSELEQVIKRQIEALNAMDLLITFDSEYVSNNPGVKLPPLENIGVLKSHFTTQRKACEGVLSLTARHLPRLKTAHDAEQAKKKALAKAESKKQISVSKIPTPVIDKQVERIPIENPQINKPEFMSLF